MTREGTQAREAGQSEEDRWDDGPLQRRYVSSTRVHFVDARYLYRLERGGTSWYE
jgi:hypothetical protein